MTLSSTSFGRRLYSSFVATFGPLFTVLGVLLGVAAFFVIPPASTVELRVVLLICLAILYVLIVFIHAAVKAHEEAGAILPAVRYASNAPASYRYGVALLLLEKSELFGYDTLVSIYLIADDVEELVGIGKVINIQQNGMIQVLVQSTLGHVAEWEKVTSNNVALLRQLVVKPNVPAFALEDSSSE